MPSAELPSRPSDETRVPPTPTLTRRVRFRASHAYGRGDWEVAKNRAVFGAQMERHEHDWVIEATVTGALDPETGWVVDLTALDAALEELRGRLAGREVGEAVPDHFGPGKHQPSTEELARWAWSRLADRLPETVRLVRVRVVESDDLWASCTAPEAEA